MVKDHSDNEGGHLLLPLHGLSYSISKGCFICTSPDRIVHTMAFVTCSCGALVGKRIAHWVHQEVSIWWPITPWVDALPLLAILYTSKQKCINQFDRQLLVNCVILSVKSAISIGHSGPLRRINLRLPTHQQRIYTTKLCCLFISSNALHSSMTQKTQFLYTSSLLRGFAFSCVVFDLGVESTCSFSVLLGSVVFFSAAGFLDFRKLFPGVNKSE